MNNQVAQVSKKALAAVEPMVPAGYKQTEVGVIPEDWELSDIKHISALPMQNGLFYEPRRKGTGVPLINVGDMYAAAPIDVDTLELFDATENEIKVFRVKLGDLFFTRSSVVPSGIAYCNIFNSESDDVVFDSHLIRVRPNTEIIDSKYLYLNCISKHARAALISEAKTATMTTIDQGAINRCPVLVPPRKEQTAIANALSDVDALIGSLEALIVKKQAIKTATMQQLLTGRTRLPQFATHPDGRPKGYKTSELGEIPEDWEVVPFGSLFESKSTQRKKLAEDEEVSFVGMQDVSESARLLQTQQLAYSRIKSGLTYFERGDVLVAKITPCFENGKGCHTEILKTEVGFGSTEFHVLKANQDADSWFIYFWTIQADFRMKLESEMVGSAGHRRVPLSAITAFNIPSPSCREEQTAIATILSDMDEEIQSLEARLTKTRDLKQGMMQQLLTGKIRLVKPLAGDEHHAG
ncbi:restriction endonuclease subunit S [Oceanimonas smirnovii]|uniref:restriction endonuclease subunit S n=1 Tax=Oceanimonas smirnovii TaxID=264574 RepID=UPI003FD41804